MSTNDWNLEYEEKDAIGLRNYFKEGALFITLEDFLRQFEYVRRRARIWRKVL